VFVINNILVLREHYVCVVFVIVYLCVDDNYLQRELVEGSVGRLGEDR